MTKTMVSARDGRVSSHARQMSLYVIHLRAATGRPLWTGRPDGSLVRDVAVLSCRRPFSQQRTAPHRTAARRGAARALRRNIYRCRCCCCCRFPPQRRLIHLLTYLPSSGCITCHAELIRSPKFSRIFERRFMRLIASPAGRVRKYCD